MEPWWTGVQAGWFGAIAGTAVGVCGALLGTIGGVCAPRGKCKGLVQCVILVPQFLGGLSLVAGIMAVSGGQPYHVWYPLLLLGGITMAVFGSLLPVFRARYRQADMRRLEAEELRRS